MWPFIWTAGLAAALLIVGIAHTIEGVKKAREAVEELARAQSLQDHKSDR